MELGDYGESLAYDIAFWIQGLDNDAYPAAKLGRLSLELSEKLRALAIITLLVKAEPDYFYHNLIRSGRAREIYLRRVRDAGLLEDHHLVLGRYEPLLDAVAAGDFELARRIRALSPAQYRPGHEYADDHWYAQLIHELSESAPEPSRLTVGLAELEAALEGRTPARLDVCRALVNRDQDLFDASFADQLASRAEEITREKARGKLEDPPVAAQRSVYIEGLALLRLAEQRGLTTASEYSYCPSLARVQMVTQMPDE
jgi:hypothetical protein